jgi:hypothetical protein
MRDLSAPMMKKATKSGGIALLIGAALLLRAAGPVYGFQWIDSPEAVAREVLGNLEKGRFDRVLSRFEAGMQQRLSEVQISNLWNNMIRQHGAYGGMDKVWTEQSPGGTIVVQRCRFGRTRHELRMVFEQPGSMASLYFVAVE